ncbi:type IV pilus modification PilV family protein [Paractinoplanes hotanensis]|uniref:Type II secretion system GspH family protein n=1 Tax=Paractinoplanes hotanensis TaxID=2906497 RepID=A0ABT0XZP4_9ACTN|nr:type II secretion system protein [Actinoplanes hotanensis]MCM4078693.1 type II secretion system GspH family protein [Actinoplanes hotanensis]
MRDSASGGAGEEGFSLVEVLVALAVLSITLLASTPFFVGSLRNVNKQRTEQAAIQLADTAMEQVRGLKGSSLLTGHGQQAGEAQFAAAPAAVKPYLATMQVGHDEDNAVLPTDGADAPISTAAQVTTVEGTPYTRMIYIGMCEVYLTRTGDCVYPLGSAAEPADKTKILKFFRAVVLITWPDNSCAATPGNPPNTCLYVTSTLVSRAPEPNFDLHRPSPIVLTQSLTFYRGILTAAQLEARGGQLPNTWTVGALPAGLSMTPLGVINGTPATVGVTVTTTTVTDKLNRTDTEPIRFTVVLPTTVTAPADATNHVGEAVALQATAANGVGPYVYSSSTLAPGLTINPGTGAITGTITTAGAYTSTITATDQNGIAGSSTYTHTVLPAVTLGPLADQAIDIKSKLVMTAVGAGGNGNYSYSAAGLPPGVTINDKNGKISEKVDVTGRFLPTITVTDSLGGAGGTASRRLVLIVNTTNSLIFTAPALAAPDQTTVRGTPASLALTTNGSLLGLSPIVTVTGLPPGLTYNALSGAISGTPTTAGAYTVTATATTVTATSVLTLVWTVT